MRTEWLCISVIRVASGPSVKLAGRKSAFNPPVVYSTDRSKAVVPMLVLLFVICGLFYEAICLKKKGKRKVQGVPQSQTAALPKPKEEGETDKSKQAQTEQTYEKH